MELFQLRYATTLANLCNFTKAAEELFISQPTLTQQIQRLEHEIGFPLFLRTRKSVKLTAAGTQFITAAQNVLREADALEKEVKSISRFAANKIVFGTSPFGAICLSESIPKFLTEFPQLNFQLVEYYDGDLIEKVHSKEIDLAFVSLPQNHPLRSSLHYIPIFEEQIVAVVKQGHELAEKGFATISDLAEYSLVFSSPRSIMRKVICDAFDTNGLLLKNVIDISKHDVRLPLIMNNMISFGLSKQGQWNTYPEVVLVPLKPAINVTCSLIFPADYKPSLELGTLIQAIQEDVLAHYKQHSGRNEEN